MKIFQKRMGGNLKGVYLLVIFILSILISTSNSQNILSRNSNSQFTSVNGTNFIQNGEIKRYGGTNCYYIMYSDEYMVSSVLETASEHNFNLIRTWAFIEIGYLNNDSITLSGPAGNGVYFHYLDSETNWPKVNEGEDGLVYLDYLLFRAAQFNVQLIFTLSNNWQDFVRFFSYLL